MPRRAALLALLLLLPAASGCAGERRAPPRPPAVAEMEGAWEYARALRARQAAHPESLTPAELLSLAYLERLRLGMGSPFRLMDQALQDPRLVPAQRTRVAAALLHAAGAGRAYAVDARALAPAVVNPQGRARAAERHLALIQRAVAGAGDPRAGELAVRGAYLLAAAEEVVPPHAATAAAYAAAQARDRELARRDARALLDEAARTGRHPLALLRAWRAARRFQVEAPGGGARAPYLEVRAAAEAVPLAARIRAIAGDTLPHPRRRTAAADSGFLAPAAARRLSAVVRGHAPPPSAPLRVTLDRYRALLLEGGGAAVRRLVENGASEEAFVAELARVPARARTPRVAAAVLEAAVALRPYAQEAVWHPGFPAPSAADLKRAYGVEAVRFDPDVPLHWRPYYRRMLGESLADLESVLPSMDVQGLTFRIGRTGREGTAVAIHDPWRRAIHLPPGTGPGVIAHEVAHDVDWQVGRRRYGRRGMYGTDLALDRGEGDGFAAAVRRLPVAPVPGLAGDAARRRRYESRPAETFARLFDGYVTSLLAARGRSNGYLSSLQDDVLAGYGTAVAPDARGAALDAFLDVLATASPLTPALEAEFRLRWGRGTPGPLALAAEVAGSPAPAGDARAEPAAASLLDRTRLDARSRARIAAVEERRDQALRTRAALVCANPFLSPVHDGETAVRALLHAAADARIHGVLREWARRNGVDAHPAVLKRGWIDPAPWPAEEDASAPWRVSAGGGLSRLAGCPAS